jgi:uncharacterized membrane protein YgcG
MTIDPSHLTQLRRKPTKGFRRFAELMTGNLISKREEHETFTALSIMQEINIALRSVGVTDVVKFTKDEQVLYEDQASTSADDMPMAIETLARGRSAQRDSFSSLSLLLEHHLATVAVIIEIKVSRVHEIGIYPIQISVNGLDAELQTADNPQTLKDRLDGVFASQQTYDAYTESKKAEFEAFIEELEKAFRSRMNIDNLHHRVYTNIVRPGLTPARPVTGASVDTHTDGTTAHAPMLQRYHSGSDSLMYLWMWSSFMHSNNTYCHGATIVSESGVPAFSVGEEGFNAGEGATLDPEVPFEAPNCPIEAVDGVGGEVTDGTDFGLLGEGAGDAAHSSWFDSFAFGGDSAGHDGGGGDAGGSACGSACGGGGGGCGGGGCGS